MLELCALIASEVLKEQSLAAAALTALQGDCREHLKKTKADLKRLKLYRRPRPGGNVVTLGMGKPQQAQPQSLQGQGLQGKQPTGSGAQHRMMQQQQQQQPHPPGPPPQPPQHPPPQYGSGGGGQQFETRYGDGGGGGSGYQQQQQRRGWS